MSISQAVDTLLDYESVPDDVDSLIGTPGYINTTITGPFAAAGETSTTRASAGCSGWCTPTVRCRRR